MNNMLKGIVLAMGLSLALTTSAISMPIQVFFTDFNTGAPAEFSGITSTEVVQGYTGIGTGSNVFSGNFLRNASLGNPASRTVLTLTGLPTHVSVEINFLLAIINSWDGNFLGGQPHDYFNVVVDGTFLFSETITHNLGAHTQTYDPPPGVELSRDSDLFSGRLAWEDVAYDMGLDPTFDAIPHTGSSLTIEWFASGRGWQGGDDESWAIDNVEVNIVVPIPSALSMLVSGLAALSFLVRRKLHTQQDRETIPKQGQISRFG